MDSTRKDRGRFWPIPLSNKHFWIFGNRFAGLCLLLSIASGFLLQTPAQAEDRGRLSDFMKGAVSGDPSSMVALGLRYDYGRGVPHDLSMALHWYRIAADKGYPPAEMILSQRYEIGRGVPQDGPLAVMWLRRSARHGYPPAEDALGDRYASGQGLRKSQSRALFWYFKAASKGYGESQDLLGEHYELGQGVPKNLEKAGYWYLRAAKDSGNSDAFFRLGRFAEKGQDGHGRDPVEALFWYTLAKDTSLSARKSWKELTKKLSPKEQTRAWKRATEFRARYSGRWNRWVLRP
jgi:TPR repeat protein